jgi:glycosyltransferase involved in cell wall biosynthesis
MSAPRRLNDRLEIRPVASLRNKYLEALPNAFAALIHAWLRERPRVLHIHAIGPALVAPLAKLMGMKVVVTHHGADYRRAKWNWFGRLALRLGERAALRWADRVIAVSPSLARELRLSYPRRAGRIRYIPNGAERFAAADMAPPAHVLNSLGLTPHGYVLTACRLVPEKRLHDLIAAFRKAAPGLKLVIAGAADHDDPYARGLLAEAGERVIFAGWQDRGRLATLYRNASLFVLPSAHEGLPIAALEAIAAGAPVLMSNIQANRDIGLPAHCYFPMGDRIALAAALAKPHHTYAVDGAAVAARFDWDSVAAKTLAVYESVLAERRGVRRHAETEEAVSR